MAARVVAGRGKETMKIIFLLEEKSMKTLLDIILPKIIPSSIDFCTIPHSGKSDLQSSIPKKLRAWSEPDVKFVIVQDQDSEDCIKLKNNLLNLCEPTGRNFLVRIACKELESWYFGDLKAVSKAYNKDLEKLKTKSKFRIPDKIENPKDELRKLIPAHQQIMGAKLIGPFMDIEQNTSHSFCCFVSGIKKICK